MKNIIIFLGAFLFGIGALFLMFEILVDNKPSRMNGYYALYGMKLPMNEICIGIVLIGFMLLMFGLIRNGKR